MQNSGMQPLSLRLATVDNFQRYYPSILTHHTFAVACGCVDDAGAKGIEIVFETANPNSQESAPNLSAKITRVLFKNNGMDFRPEDWNRLKKIAEGNPDESKVSGHGDPQLHPLRKSLLQLTHSY